MKALIPLAELSKLQKYGVSKFKPYNDAKKLIKEKYDLEVVEDDVLGKCIQIQEQEDWKKFFSYFVEELLGRGEITTSKVEVQGIPIEKFESLYRDLLEVERVRTQYWEQLQATKKEIKEKEQIIRQMQEREEEMKRKQEEMERKIQNLMRKLEEKEKKEKIREIENILSNLSLPKEDKEKLEKVIFSLLRKE